MSKVSSAKLSRRRLLIAGAGTAGALVAATTAPVVKQDVAAATPEAKGATDQGGGYQLTEHVLTYYKTARV